MPLLNSIICGDALEVLKGWPDEFVDLVITSPPYYALRNYGIDGQLGLEKTFEEYQEKLLAVIAEIKRVLKPTGQFWLNLGDIYGGTRWSGKGQGQPINKFRDGYRDINPNRGFARGPNAIDSRPVKMRPPIEHIRGEFDKCLLMMPERIALKMIDDQGFILRNKIKWAKQVLIKKESRTIGSVMPTSVKDRFNESGEELYFFVKNKKYYSDLDAVRMPAQTFDNYIRDRDNSKLNNTPGRTKMGGLKTNNFNYRVRDAKRKEGQPQFKASEEEINKYGKGSKYEQKYGEPWDRFGKNTKKAGNKVNDPRGNHEGGPGSWRDNLDNQEFRKRWKGQKEAGVPATYIGPTGEDHNLLNNPAGKNLPSIWQIGSEPHNFQHELGVDIDHFAIFPQALLEIPIKFGCPEKGIVLEGFRGSGTTAIVAKKLGRNYLGIELSPKYVALAEERILRECPPTLF